MQAANADVVMRALSAVRDTAIDSTLDALSEAECDTLMKYIYRGMDEGENCSLLLKWHARVLAKAGPASIVRVMTHRKGV